MRFPAQHTLRVLAPDCHEEALSSCRGPADFLLGIETFKFTCPMGNYVANYTIYALVSCCSNGRNGSFSIQLKHLPYLSESFFHSPTSSTFLQSTGRWPPRQNAHLLSPPLFANNALAVSSSFLPSLVPLCCTVNRESSLCLKVHFKYCFLRVIVESKESFPAA